MPSATDTGPRRTPGPWVISSTGSVVSASGGYVAEAYDGLPGTDTDLGIAAANAALMAAAPALEEALIGLEQFFEREGESSIDRFERIAAQFYRETGLLAPGKDAPAAGGQPDTEQRRVAYDAWIAAKVSAARSALSLANAKVTQ